MADVPSGIVLNRDRDLEGRGWHLNLRRGLLVLIAALPIIALFNVFGQRPQTSTATVAKAKLSVYAPTRLRGGLLYEARFHITAREDVKKAFLVLDPGWAEGTQINTVEPSPISEASLDGKLEFELGHIPKGRSYILFMQFQVNPTNVGHRARNVRLYDGHDLLATIHQNVTVFP
jgi:hypothetical protein